MKWRKGSVVVATIQRYLKTPQQLTGTEQAALSEQWQGAMENTEDRICNIRHLEADNRNSNNNIQLHILATIVQTIRARITLRKRFWTHHLQKSDPRKNAKTILKPSSWTCTTRWKDLRTNISTWLITTNKNWLNKLMGSVQRMKITGLLTSSWIIAVFSRIPHGTQKERSSGDW